jgi:poly-gamma-glutamate capsule biosynthesis protein CapA/YwtB (metallophosphatase superfamily)
MGGRAVKHRGGAEDARGHRVRPAGGSRRHRAAVGLAALLGLAGLLGSACSAAAPAAPKPASSASASPARSGPGSATAPAATPRPPAASVTLAAVGDMMLGDTPDLAPDPGTYFNAVKSRLDSGAQIVFGNLEGTLTTATASKCGTAGPQQNCFAFKNPPRYIRYFKDAGFTVLNDANNHSFDFGAAGRAQTVQTIHRAGLAQTGLPGEITVVTANGVKVAFTAFAPYDYDASLLDLPAARTLVEQAAREAPIVVVYMHAGAEGSDADHVTGHEEFYLGEDRGNAEAFAHMAIDAGASLVIASGPHVLRGLQFYRGHLIAYSLGNFAGYNNFGMTGDLGMSAILHVTLSPAGQFVRARIYPVQFAGQGQPVPGGGSVAFMAQLSAQDFGPTAARISPSGVIRAP